MQYQNLPDGHEFIENFGVSAFVRIEADEQAGLEEKDPDKGEFIANAFRSRGTVSFRGGTEMVCVSFGNDEPVMMPVNDFSFLF